MDERRLETIGAGSAGQFSGQHIAQDIDHLMRLLRHGQSCGIDLFQRVGMVGAMQDNQRFAQGGGLPRVKGGVPLLVLVAKAHHHNVGVGSALAGADGVDLG